MTGQTLLDTMEILFPELQLQPGEAGVSQGLLALNIAQDAFETLLAHEPEIMGSGVTTVVTVANTETTAYPAGLLRVDKLYYQDASGKAIYQLDRIHRAGEQVWPYVWPMNTLSNLTSGKPLQYYTNGTLIYWAPVPDQVYTIRVHGFLAKADITVSGTFLYPDMCMLPLATMAVRIIKTGLEDGPGDISSLAGAVLDPVLAQMRNFNRDGGSPYRYRYHHST